MMKVARWFTAIAAMVLAIIWLTPFGIALFGSFKTPENPRRKSILEATDSWGLENYCDFWTGVDLPMKVVNSIAVSTIASLLAVALAFPIAYAISIGKSKMRWLVLVFCVFAFSLPDESMVYPIYVAAKALGVYGQIWVPGVTLGILGSAFAVFLFTAVMVKVPNEMIEAARIDGADRNQIFFNVITPIMRTTILAVLTLTFMAAWNNYIFPLLLLPENDAQTIPLALQSAATQWSDPEHGGTNYYYLSAGAILSAIPSIVFFLIFQKSLVRGVTIGSSR
jgi:raffinose/stachyose/melibiose transport system permease protein